MSSSTNQRQPDWAAQWLSGDLSQEVQEEAHCHSPQSRVSAASCRIQVPRGGGPSGGDPSNVHRTASVQPRVIFNICMMPLRDCPDLHPNTIFGKRVVSGKESALCWDFFKGIFKPTIGFLKRQHSWWKNIEWLQSTNT